MYVYIQYIIIYCIYTYIYIYKYIKGIQGLNSLTNCI